MGGAEGSFKKLSAHGGGGGGGGVNSSQGSLARMGSGLGPNSSGNGNGASSGGGAGPHQYQPSPGPGPGPGPNANSHLTGLSVRIPPSEMLAPDSAPTSNAGSGDSLISNADISMQPAAGWRHERPTPVLVGSGCAAMGFSPQGAAPAAATAGAAAAAAAAGAAAVSRPVDIIQRKMHDNLRRSMTHEQLSPTAQGSPAAGSANSGAPSTQPAAGTWYGPSRGGADGSDGSPVATAGARRGLNLYPLQVSDATSPRGGAPDGAEPHAAAAAGGAPGPVSQEQASQESRAAGGRVRRHSTSSPNSFLGKLVGSLPLALDRSSIQEWSTTSKLAQKAIQRSDSMHSRMAQLVLRARQHGVRRKRRGSMELITTRGPGSFVGGLCVGPGAKPQHSKSAVVARGPVTLLLIRSEKINKYRNQPGVMAALNRSQNASMVQEAMERFVECEQEVAAVEIIRRTITTDPNMALPESALLDHHEHHSHHLQQLLHEEMMVHEDSMPAIMADVYGGPHR